MTGRGTPSRFLTSVLHNGLGRYVQQLQRLSLSLSRDAPSSRGARCGTREREDRKGGGERWDWVRATGLTFAGSRREFVEREVTDFARRNPGVVIYVNPRPCAMPRIVAEYREWGRAGAGAG